MGEANFYYFTCLNYFYDQRTCFYSTKSLRLIASTWKTWNVLSVTLKPIIRASAPNARRSSAIPAFRLILNATPGLVLTAEPPAVKKRTAGSDRTCSRCHARKHF